MNVERAPNTFHLVLLCSFSGFSTLSSPLSTDGRNVDCEKKWKTTSDHDRRRRNVSSIFVRSEMERFFGLSIYRTELNIEIWELGETFQKTWLFFVLFFFTYSRVVVVEFFLRMQHHQHCSRGRMEQMRQRLSLSMLRSHRWATLRRMKERFISAQWRMKQHHRKGTSWVWFTLCILLLQYHKLNVKRVSRSFFSSSSDFFVFFHPFHNDKLSFSLNNLAKTLPQG